MSSLCGELIDLEYDTAMNHNVCCKDATVVSTLLVAADADGAVLKQLVHPVDPTQWQN